jgi:radical SAM protein with 4Fe4S-binding SPASM domain
MVPYFPENLHALNMFACFVPCCFDKDASHPMGNLQESTFKEVWNSNNYRHFRGKLLQSRDQIDICKNCTEGTKVWG